MKEQAQFDDLGLPSTHESPNIADTGFLMLEIPTNRNIADCYEHVIGAFDTQDTLKGSIVYDDYFQPTIIDGNHITVDVIPRLIKQRKPIIWFSIYNSELKIVCDGLDTKGVGCIIKLYRVDEPDCINK